MIDALIADLRLAVRTLARAPSFTVSAVATIGLAIGATAAVFAVVHGVVLQPLPFPESERVLALCETSPSIPAGWCGASPANVEDWRRQARTLETAGVARTESFIAHTPDGSYGVNGGIATPGFFELLRLEPALGRRLEPRDLASNHVTLVSHQFWVTHLGSDPTIVGRSIDLDGSSFEIIGVLPAGAWLPDPFADVDAWKPLTASIDDVTNRGWRGFIALGRLSPGASEAQMISELTVIRAGLARAWPEDNRDWGFRAVPLRERIAGDYAPTLWLFFGMAALVLLIACVNVASLLLVRTAARAPELAVRASVGAGRGQIVAQLLIENLVVSLAGGVVGLLLAAWAVAVFVSVAPPGLPRTTEVRIDAVTVVFTFLLASAVALLFGVGPARRAWRTDVTSTLKGARGATRADTRLRSALTAAQIAFALMLLFGAALLTRTFARFAAWDPGFARANIVTTWMLPPQMEDAHATVALMTRVRDSVAQIPGVAGAALASAGPLFGGEEVGTMAITGRPAAADQEPTVRWFDVDPGFFSTLGIPLRRGRGFTAADRDGAPAVAIVNQALATRLFPGEDPLGREISVERHPATIVGIVADVRPLRPDEATAPEVYWPIAQFPRGGAYLVIRTASGVAGLRDAVQARVAAVHPDIQLSAFTTIEERLARRLNSPRFNMLLVGAFALVAMLLAAVGVYGVAAYTVTTRTREFAVRMAIGSTPGQLVRGVLAAGARVAGVGIGLGAVGALLLGRTLTAMLYGVPAADPLSLAAAIVLLGGISLQAMWLPARRASRIDPSLALRGL